MENKGKKTETIEKIRVIIEYFNLHSLNDESIHKYNETEISEIFKELHSKEIVWDNGFRGNILKISSDYQDEYLIFSIKAILEIIKFSPPNSKTPDFNNEEEYNFDVENEKFLKFYTEFIEKNQTFNLLDVKQHSIDIDEKQASIFFEILFQMVLSQNFKFLQKDTNNLFINIIVFLGYLLNEKSHDPKWNFYNFAQSCVVLLTQNSELQSARDLAESIYLISLKEDMINAGLYVQMSIFVFQKKINDSLYYILGFMQSIDGNTPRGVIISCLVNIQKIFRDHHMIEFEDIVFNFLISEYNEYFNTKMYLQIYLIHFATKIMKGIDIANELEKFLNEEREKIFTDGIESLVICYSILKSTLRIFESHVLENYLTVFGNMIPPKMLEGINSQFGETDRIPEKYNLISSRISKTRYHEDMVSEIKNHIPFFHSMIRKSYTNQDFKLFINSFLFLSDLTLEHNEVILSEKLQMIFNEEQENIDTFDKNWIKFNESYSKNENTLFWVGVEDSIYILSKNKNELKIDLLELTNADYFSLMRSLQEVVKFEGEKELEFDQMKIYEKQLSEFGNLRISSDIRNSICIVTDNNLSSLPFNLLQSNGDFIFLNNPLFSIPSNGFQNRAECIYIDKNITFWSPIETGDIVLNKAYNSIESILEFYNSEIYAGINIQKLLSTDIDIIIAHGGNTIDKKNTISAESSFTEIPQKYTYSNIEDAFNSPKIILFFVCHSGKISKDFFFERQNTILKKFFIKGAEVVIAPKWPLNIDILPIWLDVFLNSLISGNSSLKSFHLASLEVYRKYKNIGAWGCLHYFGNKDVFIRPT